METIDSMMKESKTERMCKSKVRYESDMRAAASAGRVAFHHKRVMRVYECPICEGFHLATVAAIPS